MSRVIHGSSEEVKSVNLTRPTGEVEAYTGRSFKGAKIEGTFTKPEMDQAMAHAQMQGKMEGSREAEQKLTAPIRQSLQNIENLLDELSVFRRELFKEAQSEVIEVIQMLAKKIFRHELSISEEHLKEFTEKALEVVERERRISMVINPKDAKMFAAAKGDFLQNLQGIEKLEIGTDPKLAQGSAVIRTKKMELDVNVDSVVDHLISQLTSEKVESPEVNDDEDTI